MLIDSIIEWWIRRKRGPIPRGFRVTEDEMETTDPANWRFTDEELLGQIQAGDLHPLSYKEAVRQMELFRAAYQSAASSSAATEPTSGSS